MRSSPDNPIRRLLLQSGFKPIEELSEREDTGHQYVRELINERMQQVQALPVPARNLLEQCDGVLIDVGPGEGVSSMALARLTRKAFIVGIEMDRKHLAAAWPYCKEYQNLELFWGAVPPHPSNSRVEAGQRLPDASIEGLLVPVLFSWLGISRKDVFGASNHGIKWFETHACL